MESNTYTVKLTAFEGPFDLLLQLIEERKLHINDISLARVTDDYLAHIAELETFPLREAAHFILVASTLVLIKSRSLLPSLALTDEEDGDIKDLERRLKEYKRIKELSEHTQRMFNRNVIFIPPHVHRSRPPVFSPTKKMTLAYMYEAIQQMLLRLPKKEMIPQAFVKKIVSLEETIVLLMERIKKDLNVRFKDFSGDNMAGKIHIIVSFLAVLELLKRGVVMVKQQKHFGDIHIEHNKISNSPNFSAEGGSSFGG